MGGEHVRDRAEILDYIADEGQKWEARSWSHMRAALAARLAGDIAAAETEDREAVRCAVRKAEFGELARMAGEVPYDADLWGVFEGLRATAADPSASEPRGYDDAVGRHRAAEAAGIFSRARPGESIHATWARWQGIAPDIRAAIVRAYGDDEVRPDGPCDCGALRETLHARGPMGMVKCSACLGVWPVDPKIEAERCNQIAPDVSRRNGINGTDDNANALALAGESNSVERARREAERWVKEYKASVPLKPWNAVCVADSKPLGNGLHQVEVQIGPGSVGACLNPGVAINEGVHGRVADGPNAGVYRVEPGAVGSTGSFPAPASDREVRVGDVRDAPDGLCLVERIDGHAVQLRNCRHGYERVVTIGSAGAMPLSRRLVKDAP